MAPRNYVLPQLLLPFFFSGLKIGGGGRGGKNTKVEVVRRGDCRLRRREGLWVSGVAGEDATKQRRQAAGKL